MAPKEPRSDWRNGSLQRAPFQPTRARQGSVSAGNLNQLEAETVEDRDVDVFSSSELLTFFGMPTSSTESAYSARAWSVSLARFGGCQIRVSYAILVAAVVLALFALTVSESAGNADLPRVVGLGALFWCSGWLVQGLTYVLTTRLLGLTPWEVCLGMLGVEVGRCHWRPRHVLQISAVTVASLIVLGSVYGVIDGVFRLPSMLQSDTSIWTAPSLGFGKRDAIWKTAAWLCWAQAMLQLYPLPRTPGRQLIGAASLMLSLRLPRRSQVAIFRRCLVVISFAMLLLAIAILVTGASPMGVNWLIFFLLALMLWISSIGSDLEKTLDGFQSFDRAQFLEDGKPQTLARRIRESLRQWHGRRRMRRAQRLERGEAVDAKRLDEILRRLHQEGMSSLSVEDRRILGRVSETLRRERAGSSTAKSPIE